MAEEPEAQEEQRIWAGGELLLYAIAQLALVSVAYHIDRKHRPPLVSTSSWAILFGLVCGGLINFLSERRAYEAGLDPQILFFGLLPPIILEAGFNTQRKGFFSNFAAILILAIGGTLVAAFATGAVLVCLVSSKLIPALTSAEAFMFGSLISAVDPVTTLLVLKKCRAPPTLFNLVFGESVLNDAAAIVLFTLFQKVAVTPDAHVDAGTVGWLSLQLVGMILGSVLLSGVICFASAYLLHHSDPTLRQHPTYEISALLLSAYASYLGAEFVQLSGILAVFFSGVFIRHYHTHSVSKASAFAFKYLLSTLSFLAENFLFLYLGISVVSFWDDFRWDWPFVLASFGACLIARACSVLPLCSLVNCWRSRRSQIPFRHMLVIWFSGLRGAVAFALALNAETHDPTHLALIRTSTIFTVLVTSVVFGMFIGPLLEAFKIASTAPTSARSGVRASVDSYGEGEARAFGEEDTEAGSGEQRPLLRVATPPPQPISPTGLRTIRTAWVALDERYLKPMFGGRRRPAGEQPGPVEATSWDDED